MLHPSTRQFHGIPLAGWYQVGGDVHLRDAHGVEREVTGTVAEATRRIGWSASGDAQATGGAGGTAASVLPVQRG